MSFQLLKSISTFNNYQVENLTCSICSDSLQEKEVITHAGTNEPHAFHINCIREWVARRAVCPVCVFEVTHVNGESIADIKDSLEAAKAAVRNANRVREDELVAAVTNGNLAEVTELLQGEFSNEARGRAVIGASRNNRIDIVQAILANGDIPQNERGIAVEWTAQNNRLDIMNALLETGDINDNELHTALSIASSNGNLAMVNRIIDLGNISPDHYINAMASAVRSGHLEIVERFLEVGGNPLVFGPNALKIASENNQLLIVQALLPRAPLFGNANFVRGEAVVSAVKKGHEGIVQTILTAGAISEWAAGESLKEAVKLGSIPIVNALLASGSIPDAAKNEALQVARERNDRHDIIQAIENSSVNTQSQQQDCEIM